MKPRKAAGIMNIHSTSWSCPLLIQKTSPTAYLPQLNEISFSEGGGGVEVLSLNVLFTCLYLASAKKFEWNSQVFWMFPLCRYQVTAVPSCSQPSNYCSKNGKGKPFSWAHTELSSWFRWDLHGHIPMAFGRHLEIQIFSFCLNL